MKRFVSWAAVSTLPQAKKISLEDQLATNKEHIEHHSGTLVEELIVPGESRSIILFEDACRKIDAYAKLKTLIDANAFDVLIYLDRSRLGRKASLSMAVVELCHSAGIQTYETESPPQRLEPPQANHDEALIGAIKSVGAQREIERLVERNIKGMPDRIRKGLFGYSTVWGYEPVYNARGEITHYVIDETVAETVRTIVDWYLHRGWGAPKIAEELTKSGRPACHSGTWYKTSVRWVLSKVWTYAGYSELNHTSKTGRPYVRYKGQWEPIISEETAQLVTEEIQRRVNARRAISNTYRFSLVAWCATCGKRMSAHGRHRRERGKEYFAVGYCCKSGKHKGGIYISEKKLHKAMTDLINELEDHAFRSSLLVPETVESKSALDTELERYLQQQEMLQQQLERADTAYVSGAMNAERYEKQIKRITASMQAAGREIERVHQELATVENQAQRAERIETIQRIGLERLNDPNVQTANAWIRKHFRVWVANTQVEQIDIL